MAANGRPSLEQIRAREAPRSVVAVPTLLRFGIYNQGVLVAAAISQHRAAEIAANPIYGRCEVRVFDAALVEPVKAGLEAHTTKHGPEAHTTGAVGRAGAGANRAEDSPARMGRAAVLGAAADCEA